MSSGDKPGQLASMRLIWRSWPLTIAGAARRPFGRAAGVLLLYGLLALAMLSPLAADAMPESPAQDLANHVSGIIEARNALAEGQFPIRVAPNQNNRERYPIFQFYGNLPYTAGGLLYLATGLNPYAVWKLVIFIVLVIGALFTYRCAALMTRRRLPAMVGGAVFLTAPYLIIDIHSRFAYPEVVSFGILPCVFFYTMRSFTSRKLAYVLLSAVAWSCLALSHNITFLYTSVFFSLYLLTFARLNMLYVWRMIRVGVGYSVGVLLVAWYLVPQLFLLPNLLISTFPAEQTPYVVAWLTPLHVLLAPTLVSPIPPSLDLVPPPRFGLQIGWPILLAVGLTFFCLYRPARLVQRIRVMIARLLLFFLLTFFMVWNPIDFWIYLPKIFSYIQFSYRLLMFVVLWGALLAAYALAYTFRQGVHVKHMVAVVAVLVLFAVPYLTPHTPSSRVSVYNEIHTPNMGRGGANYAYVLAPSAIVATTIFHRDVNLADWDYNIVDSRHRLLYPGKGELPAPRKGDSLIISGQVPAEYKTPVKLTVVLDNTVLASVSLKTGTFKLALPITTIFTSERVQIQMQTDRYLHPVRRVPALPEPGVLMLEIGEIRWKSSVSDSIDEPLLSMAEVKKTLPAGSPTTYMIHNREARLVQLPVFFYPNMLRVRDNGRIIPYGNLGHVVALRLPPGDHVITAHFVGVEWANVLSLLAWVSILLAIILITIRYYLRNKLK
ncbi:MAG: 6-pyruvoyl-tetrahydropterin synthase-related protein [Roseiflexaceae bacterium]